jgi:hypothetical protein
MQKSLNPARQAVLNTTELLENILSYLPFQDLFVLQRVSRQLGAAITAAPGLQQKMFLRPQSATLKETWALEGDEKLGMNNRHHRGSLKFRRVDNSQTTVDSRYHPRIPITLNPALAILGLLNLDARAVERAFVSGREIVRVLCHPAAVREHSSFLNMLVSDPPCRVAGGAVSVKFDQDHGNDRASGHTRLAAKMKESGRYRVESNTGLTIGDCLRAAFEVKDDDHCRTELKELFDRIVNSDGRVNCQNVEGVMLYVEFLKDGETQPLIPTEAERAAVIRN